MVDTTMYRMTPDEVCAVKKEIVRLILDEGQDYANPTMVCDAAMRNAWNGVLKTEQIPEEQWDGLIEFAAATIAEWNA
jgi:hypothetical protein